MALGVIKIIPASSHVTASLTGSTTAGGGQLYNACAILNPNDGVLYVAQNRDCPDIGYGSWDWKVPSQSYALLPGHFHSVGMYYLDQSGSGRQGEVTVYPSSSRVDIPIFQAIGRALQTLGTALDMTEGPLPQNPGSGILRLWPDTTDVLHILNSAGVDRYLLDSRVPLDFPGLLRTTSVGATPIAGTGLEIGYNTGGPYGFLQSVQRGPVAFQDLYLIGKNVVAQANGGTMTLPVGTAFSNLGAHGISLVSTSGFGGAIATTSATLVPTSDVINFTFAQAGDLIVLYQGSFQNTVGGNLNIFQLYVDNALIDWSISYHQPAANYDVAITMIGVVTGLAAGTHNCGADFATSGGTLAQGGVRLLTALGLYR